MNWNILKPIDLSKIETISFPDDKYFYEIYEKKQIVLHHTMGSTVDGAISTWKQSKDNVAVCMIIDKTGLAWQLFSSKYWSYHIGAGNHDLDKHSIAIELINWGYLTPGNNGKYKTYYGNEVYVPVQYYPNGFRGYNYYEKYSDAQIKTLGELLLYWKMRYSIPLKYNPDMWDVTQNALKGTPGIWGHISYLPKPVKYDPHPQPNLIEMLQTLSTI
jgi:hypothetical protein